MHTADLTSPLSGAFTFIRPGRKFPPFIGISAAVVVGARSAGDAYNFHSILLCLFFFLCD